MQLSHQEDCNDIIDKRLYFSLYHKILIAIIGLVLLVDGSEALSLSLMLPCIVEEFKLDSTEKKVISTMYYVGIMIGAVTGGIIADINGRKKIFTYTCLMTALLGFSAYLIHHYITFLFIRFFFGFLIGVVSPLSVSIITESFPTDLSGRIFILCRIGLMVGELFSACLGVVFIEKDLKHGNWRALLIIPAFPALIGFALSYKYLIEPPRYYLAKKDIHQAELCLRNISQINTAIYNTFDSSERNTILDFITDITVTVKLPLKNSKRYLKKNLEEQRY